jgi:hypothetical protein
MADRAVYEAYELVALRNSTSLGGRKSLALVNPVSSIKRESTAEERQVLGTSSSKLPSERAGSSTRRPAEAEAPPSPP